MTVSASAPFKYIAFKMRNPERIALEIEGVTKVSTRSLAEVDDELISGAHILRFDKSANVRVEVGLRKPCSFDTSMSGTSLVLTISPDIPKTDTKTVEELAKAKETIEKLNKKMARLENRIKELENKRVTPKTDVPRVDMARTEKDDRLAIPPVSRVKTAEEIATKKIKIKIKDWLEAWRSQDILRYSDHYAASFSHKGMSKGRWLKSKKRKFRLAGSIDVNIDNIIVKILNRKAVVKFTQIYRSEGLSDIGNKTLTMSLIGREWKIVSEMWRPVR